MRPFPASDTTDEAERVQLDLLREASVSRRLRLACSLTATVMSAARRGLLRSDPDLDPAERDLRFVELHYGYELAAALREDMERRRSTIPP